MVLIFSEHSNNSEHVGNEIYRAFNFNKPIIPFAIEKIETSEEFDYYLGRKYWLIAYSSYKEKIQGQIIAVKRLLGKDEISILEKGNECVHIKISVMPLFLHVNMEVTIILSNFAAITQ